MNAKIAQIRQIFLMLLEAEEHQALAHRSDPYWSSRGHNVGDDEIDALWFAMQIDLSASSYEVAHPESYVERISSDLKSAAIRYIQNARDTDGFGSATLVGLRRKFIAATEKPQE